MIVELEIKLYKEISSSQKKKKYQKQTTKNVYLYL